MTTSPDSATMFLRRDPVLGRLIDQYSPLPPVIPGDFFTDFVETIIGQQLSNKVATVILRRFYLLAPKPVLPEQVLHLGNETIRACGISYAKIAAIQGAAVAILEGKLEVGRIATMSDEEAIDYLTRLRGVGRWTAEMLLIFHLRRPDVFSLGDLGLRTAVSQLYGVDRQDVPTIFHISQSWSPYRTMASRYLWRSLDNT